MKETITLNFDGGSRGNPGPAGLGIVLSAEDGTPLVTLGKYIGAATNNVAEYMALILGVREAKKLGAKKIRVRGDSELVIRQLRGEYRVKNPGLKHLFDQVQELLNAFESVSFEHVVREKNSLADRLANRAMDHQGDVDDIDAGGSLASAAPAISHRQLTCSNCGCQIEIRKPSSKAKVGGQFLCPCGHQLE